MLKTDRNQLLLSSYLHPSAHSSQSQKLGIALKRVSVRVSTPRPGEAIVPTPEFTTLLVQTSTSGENTAIIRLSGQSMDRVMQRQGDTCSLDSGSIAIVHSSAGKELIRYDVPKDSFQLFSKLHASAGVDAFAVPDIVCDTALHLLSRTIQPLLGSKDSISSSFAGYFVLSLYSHLAERYGREEPCTNPAIGGLSPRNQRRVEERLRESSGLGMSLESLALECQLSARHFARAFQKSFGVPFHKYQRDFRLQFAKQLLAESELPIRDVAVRIGYADQASFTESFKRDVGLPPGKYRRQYSSPSVLRDSEIPTRGRNDSILMAVSKNDE